jgi:ABC-2 type transport system permease protein
VGRRVGFFARPARRTISIKSATSASYSALTSGTASSRPASLWCAGNRVTVLGWVGTLLCIGTALGTFARNLGELSAIQDVGGLALTGLGGALVPLAVLPAWVHHVAEFSPGYWGVHSMRWALDGNAGGVLFAEFVLGCFAIAAIAAAAWRIRRGWQRGQVM